jgi:predicted RNase H-like nuclease
MVLVRHEPPVAAREALGSFAEVRSTASMRFVGVDLAWGPNGGTGICVASAGKVIRSSLVRSDDEIISWLKPHVAGPCIVAVDAPLIVRNANGRRDCERLISHCFWRYHAGAHSSNLSLAAFRNGVRAERIAQALDLDVDPYFAPRAAVRRVIEVYPHPAIVTLFGLERILKYKAKRRRGVEARREEFIALLSGLEGLRVADPAFDVTASPRWPSLHTGIATTSSGAELDRLEDELDAYVCAYVAVYYWTHGSARCRVVGDTGSGYIVTPVTEEIARCLDAL